MSDIAILKEMIKDTATVLLEDSLYDDKKKQVTLTEPGPPDYFVTIFGMPNNAIVIKGDAFPAPEKVFNCSKGECKRADFVIVADTGEKQVILCIEMKARATTSTELGIIQQLQGAQCLVAYYQAIGKVFWGQKNFLDSYVYRFISLRNIHVSQRMIMHHPKTGIHDCPEQMLKINSPYRLQFEMLVGKMSKK